MLNWFIVFLVFFGIATPAVGLCSDQGRGITVAPDVNPAKHSASGVYWALIIGIDKYEHGLPQLRTAVHDATAIRNILRDRYGFQPEHIITLFNERATREAIEDALEELVNRAGVEDRVFIYYAGHGETDTAKLRGWWIPADGRSDSIGTFLSNADVRDIVASMKAKHVFLIADACFSGTLFGKYRAIPPAAQSDAKYILRMEANKSRWALTSGMREPVADEGKDGHSVFAYFLLKVLEQNDQPYITPSSINEKLTRLVAANSDQVPQGGALQFAGDEGGQFIFRLASVASNSLQQLNDEGKILSNKSGEVTSMEHELASKERDQLAMIEDRRRQLEAQEQALRELDKKLTDREKALQAKPPSLPSNQTEPIQEARVHPAPMVPLDGLYYSVEGTSSSPDYRTISIQYRRYQFSPTGRMKQESVKIIEDVQTKRAVAQQILFSREGQYTAEGDTLSGLLLSCQYNDGTQEAHTVMVPMNEQRLGGKPVQITVDGTLYQLWGYHSPPQTHPSIVLPRPSVPQQVLPNQGLGNRVTPMPFTYQYRKK